MDLKRKLISFLLYDGLTEADYKSIYKDIHEQNRKNMVCYTILMCIIFSGLFILTFFASNIEVNRPYYGIAFLFSAILCIALRTAARDSWLVTCILNYVFCTMILGFCIYIGTFTAEGLATAFCVSLTILPFVTYDMSLRSSLYRLAMCLVFFLVDFYVKDFFYVSRDLVNVICYYLLGTFAACVEQTTQAQAFYLKRNMNEAIRQKTEKIEKLSHQYVFAMASAVDAKDKYTNGHSRRVADYVRMLADAMGKSPEVQNQFYCCALLHDIGKIGIPDAIINKPEPLSPEEYAVIKTHSLQGYEILKGVEELPEIAIGAKYHHERYDGMGYPDGLAGEDIPEIARFIAVADAYDAMTSNRTYRKVMMQQEAYEEIEKGMGTQFDPVIASHMLNLIKLDKDFKYHG